MYVGGDLVGQGTVQTLESVLEAPREGSARDERPAGGGRVRRRARSSAATRSSCSTAWGCPTPELPIGRPHGPGRRARASGRPTRLRALRRWVRDVRPARRHRGRRPAGAPWTAASRPHLSSARCPTRCPKRRSARARRLPTEADRPRACRPPTSAVVLATDGGAALVVVTGVPGLVRRDARPGPRGGRRACSPYGCAAGERVVDAPAVARPATARRSGCGRCVLLARRRCRCARRVACSRSRAARRCCTGSGTPCRGEPPLPPCLAGGRSAWRSRPASCSAPARWPTRSATARRPDQLAEPAGGSTAQAAALAQLQAASRYDDAAIAAAAAKSGQAGPCRGTTGGPSWSRRRVAADRSAATTDLLAGRRRHRQRRRCRLTAAWTDPTQATVLAGITDQLAPAGHQGRGRHAGQQLPPPRSRPRCWRPRLPTSAQTSDSATALLAGLAAGRLPHRRRDRRTARPALAVLLGPGRRRRRGAALRTAGARRSAAAGTGAVDGGAARVGRARRPGRRHPRRRRATRAAVSTVDCLDLRPAGSPPCWLWPGTGPGTTASTGSAPAPTRRCPA